MAYQLGAITTLPPTRNIARQAMSFRDFQSYANTQRALQAPTPSKPVTIRPANINPSVLYTAHEAVAPKSQPPATLRVAVPAPTPVRGQPTGAAGVMPTVKLPPVDDDVIAEVASPFGSPMLLIAAGLAALWLTNRRK